MLRRRVRWYCSIVLGILVLGWIGNLGSWSSPRLEDGSIDRRLIYDSTSDVLLTAVYGLGLAYVLRNRPDRRRLVGVLSLVTIAAMPPAAVLEVLSVLEDVGRAGTDNVWAAEPSGLPLLALGNLLIVQAIACLIVPMPVRESLRFSVPCAAVYAGTLVLVVGLGPGPAVGWSLLGAALMSVGPAWSAWRFREMDARFAGREALARYRDVASELVYARRVHESLFPPEIAAGPVRVSYHYAPMREVGGDFLFVWPLAFPGSPAAGRLCVVLIDVTGHGIAAALAVNRLHGELRAFFARSPEGSPGELAARLNAFTQEQLSPQAMFATALCLRVSPDRAEFASAGHPPAFLRRASGGVEAMAATAPMLGVVGEEEFEPGAAEVALGPGDQIVAFTDGLFETIDARGEAFGLERIRAHIGAEPEVSARSLADRVDAFRHGRALDDTLVVGVRV